MEVTKLKEGEWYAYRVKALNRHGASKPSKPTDDIHAMDAMGNDLFYISVQILSPSSTNITSIAPTLQLLKSSLHSQARCWDGHMNP